MSTGRDDAVDPHIKLAELMNREFGTSVSSSDVRRFISDYWDRISWFAHSIHNEVERDRAKPTRTPEQARAAIPSEQGEAAVAWQKWHDDEAGPGWDWYISKTGNMDAAIAKELSEESATLIVNALNGPAPAARVKVKALEWVRPNDDSTLSRAESAFGTYRVWTHAEAAGKWFWCLSDAPHGARPRGAVDNEVAAKAAAQTDYEARILSALEPLQKPQQLPAIDQGEPK